MEVADLFDLLAGLPLPAFILNEEERILCANDLSQEVLGGAALGRPLVLILRAPDLHEAIAEVRANGAASEILLRRKDDSQYRVKVSSLRGGRVLCVLRDVTEDMKSEEIRRDFVANVSHELRTPLTAMMGFIETLRTSARNDEGARDRFLEIMDSEAHRMHRLVRDLLQLSRVEAQERIAPKERLNLGDILTSVATSLRPIAEAKGCKIILKGLENPLLINGDCDQLTQVFTNLIENAVKYGASDARVTVNALVDESTKLLQIAVKDQGEGIDPIHLPRLTERFYRIDRHRSRSAGGTGLGLAIVKHIVNRHRGQLKIESVKGEGSTFRVSLPMS